MSGTVLRALAGLGLAALAFAGGVGVGWQRAEHAAALQAQVDLQARQEAIRKATDQARQEGDEALARLREALDQAQQHHAKLKKERRHAALSVPARCLSVAGPQPGLPAPTVQRAPAGPDADAALAVPELTLGAVSLWDSALAGADVPAGACRAADIASQACAAGAGIGLIDAWDNQAANAASCAADRRRYAELIHLLCRRPGQPGCTP